MTAYRMTDKNWETMEKLRDLLVEIEPNGVEQQMAIELLCVWHIVRAVNGMPGYKMKAVFIADSMNKHVKQIVTENIGMLVDGDHRA
jgi:hypothetical protein